MKVPAKPGAPIIPAERNVYDLPSGSQPQTGRPQTGQPATPSPKGRSYVPNQPNAPSLPGTPPGWKLPPTPPKTPFQPGIGIPGMGPGQPLPDPGNVPVEENFLNAITTRRIDDGGYRIKFNKYVPEGHAALLLVGDGRMAVDITGGFDALRLPALLSILSRANWWSVGTTRQIPCRVVIAERLPWGTPGAAYFELHVPGQRIPYLLSYNMTARSQVRMLPAPVEPIHQPVGTGPAALRPIGNTAPRLLYLEDPPGSEIFVGRVLSKCIGNRWHLFLWAGNPETNPLYRGLDCTTYIQSCYQKRFPEVVVDGFDLVDTKLGLTATLSKKGLSQVMDHIRTNPGDYILLVWAAGQNPTQTKHVMGVQASSTVHEFNKVFAGQSAGYQERTLAAREALCATDSLYSLYPFPASL